ncbi:MAG: DNA polymerase III subunit beta [Ruminococcaceae bacterium]|nr:DNA polymerase III subunit beta [Oscillospiraceae bacterium]
MKFKCSQQELMDTLNTVSRAAATKSTLMVINNIYFEARNNDVYICCYNLEMGITKIISAQVTKTGSAIIPIRLCDIVKKLPGDTVEIECDDKYMVNIRSGYSEYKLIGTSAEEFPELPTVTSDHSLDIEQGKLKSMISQTAFAISTNDQRPVCTGALFEVTDRVLRVVTVDGYRLAIRKEEISDGDDCSFIVPGKTLSEVQKILTDDNSETVYINAARNNIVFSVGGYSVISRLLSGEFINYKSAIAGEYMFDVTVNTSDIIRSTERIALMITETFKIPVRCVFNSDNITFSCDTPIGRAEDVIDSRGNCDGIDMCFNSKYMLDAFRAVDTDEMKIKIREKCKSVQIVPPEGDSFLFILMPIGRR